MRYRNFGILITILIVSLCTTLSAQETPTTRPFRMGFTPFPYDISFEAVDYSYTTVFAEGDLIMHHFDSGVPWVEALEGTISQHLQDDWNYRLLRTPENHPVFLSLTPINFDRNGLALYHGTAEDQPLPAPWDTYSFNHPDVKTAYFNYVEQAITFFSPDYVNIGIEANLLMKISPHVWDDYMELHRETYIHLKELHPDLPIFVSMTGIDLLDGYTDVNHQDQLQAFRDLIDYTDIFALSMYPYMTKYMSNEVPQDMYDLLAEWTDKPMAISETGYPAQDFGIYVGDIRVQFFSDETKQADYIQFLLDEAYQHNFVFVVNFVLRDYDALWEKIGAREDLTIAWRDTGLFDENGNERPALSIWRDWLNMPYQKPN